MPLNLEVGLQTAVCLLWVLLVLLQSPGILRNGPGEGCVCREEEGRACRSRGKRRLAKCQHRSVFQPVSLVPLLLPRPGGFPVAHMSPRIWLYVSRAWLMSALLPSAYVLTQHPFLSLPGWWVRADSLGSGSHSIEGPMPSPHLGPFDAPRMLCPPALLRGGKALGLGFSVVCVHSE